MTGEKFTISGSLSFTGTVRGIRGDLEREAENIKMELSLIAKEKFPQYTWDVSKPVSVYQKVSDRLVKV